ncbi:hypothetical protein [Streptomyces sp. CA-106131]|uniref:hypothetical protein n=1 Tax=Streptomyces sp. CA-106131 TaxID=3240045 RepID=UPI003D8EB94B
MPGRRPDARRGRPADAALWPAARALADAQAGEWKIIDLPALADSETDRLGRALGEPLWPERFDAEHHATTRRRVGERVWAALYQQKPRPPEGGVWQRAWINNVATPPSGSAASTWRASSSPSWRRARHRRRERHHRRRPRLRRPPVRARGSLREHGRQRLGSHRLLALALKADAIVVESNYGGDMARQVLSQAWEQLRREGTTNGQLMPRVLEVTAKVGKRLRAEPIAQPYEQRLVHHVSAHVPLEDGPQVPLLPPLEAREPLTP